MMGEQTMSGARKIVIVGGVAGGATAAARARRLSETAPIVVLERGPYVSFANCGLPYHIGGEITERDKLLLQTPESLRDRHRLDVRVRSEVVAIHRERKTVSVRCLDDGRLYDEPYDKLILSTGAAPIRPPLPGIDHPRIFTLRTMPDMDRIKAAADSAGSAIVVGGGFIGLEMAENLVRRGIDTTVVELVDQVLPPWDREMTTPIAQHLVQNGVRLMLSDSAIEFGKTDKGLTVRLKSGTVLMADFVMLSVGVRPENSLAVAAGLEVGTRGGIKVNPHMQTSDPDIYAVGDAVEVADFVTGDPTQIPLAGPANRQGRIAADHIFGRDSSYRGTQGTAIVGVFGMTAAMTGLSEKALRRTGRAFQKIYLHPAHHAGYYPGAERMTLKLLFDPSSGKILGAQAVGGAGVDKRIDVLATAIQARMTVFDLEEMELAYAPQYGAAKDPINMAGFIAAGVVRGDAPIAHAEDIAAAQADGILLLDVRTPQEFAGGHVPGAVNVPIDQLRDRLGEIDASKRVIAYCQVGLRGYLATRILRQAGRDAANLSGGYATYCQWQDQGASG
jgi:NADPH-dependent 2,4-dienoyl-CoA reductase/sulfur reductase-like enzyme/rhodanese-related sulfurtransferase